MSSTKTQIIPTIKLPNLAIIIILFTTPNWAWAQTQQWAKTTKTGPNEYTTTLQFYFHDTPSGKSPSAILIAQPINIEGPTPNGFGTLMMADDPLTIGPGPDSKLVGRAQGMYGAACKDEIGLVMVLSYDFFDGEYNGSSISIMGRNKVMSPVRELPVVGGTGVFRMARGFALAHTYWYNLKGDAIVGYNVTIVHY